MSRVARDFDLIACDIYRKGNFTLCQQSRSYDLRTLNISVEACDNDHGCAGYPQMLAHRKKQTLLKLSPGYCLRYEKKFTIWPSATEVLNFLSPIIFKINVFLH